HGGNVNHEERGQEAERACVRKPLTCRLIDHGTADNYGEPLDEPDEFLGHPVFAAPQKSKHQGHHDHKIKHIYWQFIEVHLSLARTTKLISKLIFQNLLAGCKSQFHAIKTLMKGAEAQFMVS